MAGRAAPQAFPGGSEFVHRGKVKTPGVGMVVREHINIGPARGAGGDQVDLAVLACLLPGDESGNLDRADKVGVGPGAGIAVAPPKAESRVALGVTPSRGSSASVAVSTALRARCRGMSIELFLQLVISVCWRLLSLRLPLHRFPFRQPSAVETNKFNAFSPGYSPYGTIADANSLPT
jgi:hypothetical protein